MSETNQTDTQVHVADHLQNELSSLQARLISVEAQIGHDDPNGLKALLRSVISHQQEVLERL